MVIQSLAQVTPEWLTAKLRERGVLPRGAVSHIEFDSTTFNQGFVSNIARLKISYSQDAFGKLPRNVPNSLFLKMSKPDVHPEMLKRGCHEISFYRAVQPIAHELEIPICYDAECDAEQRSHLLIQDLSETHFQKPLPLPPSNRHCEMIVEALAQLHAQWWNDPRLGSSLGERMTGANANVLHQRLEATLPKFMDYLGDALLLHYKRALEQTLASDFLPRLSQRLIDQQNVTLIHGDAHTGNLMLPHNVEQNRVMLIDFQLWGINVAAIDLAFLIALHWNRERRAALEQSLLRRYYKTLIANGVTNYAWDDFWNDYRESVIIMTLIPIGQFRRGSPAGVIWFGFQDSMAAFHDLHCAELLN